METNLLKVFWRGLRWKEEMFFNVMSYLIVVFLVATCLIEYRVYVMAINLYKCCQSCKGL